MYNKPYEPFDLTQRTVFGLLAQTLFDVPYTPEQQVDWEAVYQESEYQAVRMQTFAKHHLIPDFPQEICERIQSYTSTFMIRNVRIHAGHTLTHKLLTQNGIPYTVLKGAASAFYYPDPLTRAMGDVDFIVDEKHVLQVAALFREQGFDVEEYSHDPAKYHLAICKDKLNMELHYRLPGIPEGEVGEMIREYLADLEKNATLQQGKLAICRHPSAFHHGLIMLMHFQRHLVYEGIGLRHLCDWAVFVHSHSPEEFQSLFRDRLSAIGMWRFARLLSLSASLYIGLPEQPWMRENPGDEDVARALMMDIVGGGNFGRRNRQRAYEAKFLPKSGTESRMHNRVAAAIHSVNQSSRERWPIMRRVPLFLPWGWIHAVVRYLLNNEQRRKAGKKIDLGLAYKSSEARQKLYEALHMYEPF